MKKKRGTQTGGSAGKSPMETFPKTVQKQLLTDQLHEIEAYTIYSRLADRIKSAENRKILKKIAQDELEHCRLLKTYTGRTIRPRKRVVRRFFLISRIFGLTFGLKLLEKKEEDAQEFDYAQLSSYVPEVESVIQDEEKHEKEMLDMLNEERLGYMGSIVLGLNDALVELTGTLAGLSFAFQNTQIIALSGLITGIAASLSMAASEYLSTKADGGENALRSSLYTGLAYIITVILLVMPYLLLDNYLVCLFLTLSVSVIIIFLFNYYISVAKDYNFGRRFFEMAGISLGVAALSFGIGVVVKMVFGVDI